MTEMQGIQAEAQAEGKEKKEQTNVMWRQGGKAVFDEAMRAWKETQAGDRTTTGDFITWLMDHAGKAEAAESTKAALEGLGAGALYAAWQARRAADDRLLEAAADCMAQAKQQARAEVQADFSMLEKSNAIKDAAIEKAEAEIASLKEKLDAARAGKDAKAEEAAALAREKDNLAQRLADMESRLLDAAEKAKAADAATAQAQAALDQEKAASLALKEKNIDLEKQITALTRQLDQGKLAHEKADSEAQSKIAELARELAQAQARLEQEKTHAQNSADMKAELDAAKVEIARLQATIAGQQESAKAQAATLQAMIQAIGKTQPQPRPATVQAQIKPQTSAPQHAAAQPQAQKAAVNLKK